jgi:hypothetical protein
MIGQALENICNCHNKLINFVHNKGAQSHGISGRKAGGSVRSPKGAKGQFGQMSAVSTMLATQSRQEEGTYPQLLQTPGPV